jgi:Fe(3+) dicitrate transport protein
MKMHIFIWLFLLSTTLGAQRSRIFAMVQDEKQGIFLKDARLVVNGTVISPDSTGRFLAMVDPGTVKLNVMHPAYRPGVLNTKINGDTSLVFFLIPRLIDLSEVTVEAGKDNSFGIGRLNNVEGTTIYAGKKSELIYVQDLGANLAANNSRQVFSKVPGINVFENDGSGSTIGVGGRGLNPNRISNFNTRQNGYDISADALGYPESYYTPPTEAIERIEILRGAAGLQFGTQFGGMINYRFTEPPANRKFSGNFRQTTGSYGFFNSFNQLSGTSKRYSYNTFYQYKHYDGWRGRSMLNSHNAFASLKYQVNEKLALRGEYTFLNYISQQPGGLTDRQFNEDPAQVTRFRNWFRVNWNLFSLSADYRLSDRTRITANGFGLNAGRDALGFLGRTDRRDDTSAYRNLLQDNYRNLGAEVRLLHRYTLGKANSHFLIGGRYYRGNTDRKQGDADKSDLPVFRFRNPARLEHSDYTFPSRNYALFAENIFQVGNRLSVTPGLRYEFIRTESEGYYRLMNKDLAGDTLLDLTVVDNRSRQRQFVLGGIGAQYRLSKFMEVYCNISQNYRSINFNDMRVVNPNFEVDPELKDESGYTADGGFRGSFKDLLYFDAGVFLLRYNNRIGTTLKVDSNTYQIVRYRTNVGSSRNAGVEMFAELDWMKLLKPATPHKVSTFVNLSYISAVYTGTLPAIKDKRVEYVPAVIFRTGLNYAWKKLTFTWQYSYTSEQFSDATNAVSSPSGIYGVIPAYAVMDVSAGYTWKKFGLNAGVNNLANTKYFTRRAEGYPGPGIIPGDPINVYLTLRIKL